MDDDVPFITVEPAVGHNLFHVEVRRFDKTNDGYVVSRSSAAMRRDAADALAKSWAAAMKMEIR